MLRDHSWHDSRMPGSESACMQGQSLAIVLSLQPHVSTFNGLLQTSLQFAYRREQ